MSIKYTTPSTTNPSGKLQSDVSNGGEIDQENPVGNWILEFIMVNTDNPTTKSLAERQNKSATVSTSTNQQVRFMLPEALVRTIPPQGTLVGAYVEKTPDIDGSGLMHPFGGSPSHEGF